MAEDIRWRQRFQNFEKAFLLLREALHKDWRAYSDLEKQGVVQRFEICFELAWKTLKDYLEYGGVELSPISPRAVIKQAFAARILADGQLWIEMMEHRNQLAHIYDEALFAAAIQEIAARFLGALEQLFSFFSQRNQE